MSAGSVATRFGDFFGDFAASWSGVSAVLFFSVFGVFVAMPSLPDRLHTNRFDHLIELGFDLGVRVGLNLVRDPRILRYGSEAVGPLFSPLKGHGPWYSAVTLPNSGIKAWNRFTVDLDLPGSTFAGLEYSDEQQR